jgi:four helix bundle protein
MRVSVDIYKLFRGCKDYGFRDQIQRASVSVSSNIAEGFERQTDKEFAPFLFIANGSNVELRTQLYLAIELVYIDKQTGVEMIEKAKKISSMI